MTPTSVRLVACDLDGKERWRKEVPGGVLSSVAVADDVAVATATDGKVRAFDLATGDRKWIYEGAAPFFAPPAVVQGVVYAGDLRGVVHAIDLSGGLGKWKLDLGADRTARPRAGSCPSPDTREL